MSLASLHSGSVPDLATRWNAASLSDPTESFLSENLERLEARISEVCGDLGCVSQTLAEALGSAVGTDGRGGRRWRPLLTLAASQALCGRDADALEVAVAVELTHTASLVLDDLPCMDDSELRRGRPATHTQVGSAGAILLSVALLSRAVELLGSQRDGGPLCEEWGRIVGLRGMAGGQAMDVAATGRQLRGSARRLHRAKSTALPAFALASGARSAQASETTREGLAAFGRSLGWAYQLLDDIADQGEDRRLGRGPGGARPSVLSRRIMRRAYRRIREVPGVGEEGLRILIGLAGRVAIPESALRGGADADPRPQEGRG